MTHGFWPGRAFSSSCLPCWPALRGFFPPPKEGLWVLWAFDASAFGTFTACMHCSLSAGRSPSRWVYPNSNPSTGKLLCHRQDSLEFPLPTPPSARSQRVSCPGITAACLRLDPLVLRSHYYSLMSFSETQNTTSRVWGFFLLLTGSSFGCFPLQEAGIWPEFKDVHFRQY